MNAVLPCLSHPDGGIRRIAEQCDGHLRQLVNGISIGEMDSINDSISCLLLLIYAIRHKIVKALTGKLKVW